MSTSQPTSSVKDLAGAAGSGSTSNNERSRRLNSRRKDPILVLDNTIKVTTPENISFEYQLAGPFRRLFAYLLDVLVTVAGFGAVSFLIFLLMTFVIVPLADFVGLRAFVETLFGAIVGLMLVFYFLVYWFYGAFFETYFNGQTLGKRSAGLRVLSGNGHAIDGVQATLRNFFRLLDLWPAVSLAALMDVNEMDPDLETLLRSITFPTFLVGLTMMSISRKFQRVGDLVADTVVVIDTQANRPGLIKFPDQRVASLAELIPKNFVPPNQLAKAIASYIELRQNIHPQRASEIAAHVAVPLLERFGIPADTDYDLFICSLYYKTFVDARDLENDLAESSASTLTDNVKPSNFLPSNSLTQLGILEPTSDPVMTQPMSPRLSTPTKLPDESRVQP